MDNRPLALKYRPQSFSDMIGHTVTSAVLARMVELDRVPPGLLFTGVRGSGKTSAARILSNAMDAGEVIEVDAASNGSVQDVRSMIDSLRYSTGGRQRVIIYDEAHSMSKEAFNALLKTLEEPPGGTTFILVTTEPDKIIGTVKSRLMEFTFHKVSAYEIAKRLFQIKSTEEISVDLDLLQYIAERADGSVRDGIMMLDQCARAGIETKEEFLKLAGETDIAPRLVQALLTGSHEYIFATADELSQHVPDPSKLVAQLVGVLKDLLILKSGGAVEASEAGVVQRKELASSLEGDRIMAALRILWDLRTKTRQSPDPRGNLDLALILVSEVFTRGKTVKPVARPVPPEAKRLTFEEL